jgi:hypothetical protein
MRQRYMHELVLPPESVSLRYALPLLITIICSSTTLVFPEEAHCRQVRSVTGLLSKTLHRFFTHCAQKGCPIYYKSTVEVFAYVTLNIAHKNLGECPSTGTVQFMQHCSRNNSHGVKSHKSEYAYKHKFLALASDQIQLTVYGTGI